jgi:hypothetical protein
VVVGVIVLNDHAPTEDTTDDVKGSFYKIIGGKARGKETTRKTKTWVGG